MSTTRGTLIDVLQRGLLKKITKFDGQEGNKGCNKGVQAWEGETGTAQGKRLQVTRHTGDKPLFTHQVCAEYMVGSCQNLCSDTSSKPPPRSDRVLYVPLFYSHSPCSPSLVISTLEYSFSYSPPDLSWTLLRLRHICFP